MITLAVCNHKGGVGKTTTALHLAQAWAAEGINVLAIDLDPQGNLTKRLVCNLLAGQSIGDVLTKRTTITKAAQMVQPHLSVVGADIRLEDTAAALQSRSPNHQFLRHALRQAQMEVDVAIIDCAPAANILTINAMVAADHMLLVVDPEGDAIDGSGRMKDMARWLRAEIDAGPELLGYVVNRVQPVNMHRAALATIHAMGVRVFGEVPHRRGADAEAQLVEAYTSFAFDILGAMGKSC